MFPYPIAKPQKCDIQTFYGAGSSATSKINTFMWNKPVGVSHVYMMLIGAGGNGDGTSTGGGSGAVTVWYGAAQHVPNNLRVQCGASEVASEISFLSRSSVVILQAAAGQATLAGVATSAPAFAASGFYKSTAGQAGSSTNITPSTTTFLSGGADATTNDVTANYGYDSTANNADGYFLMQPIIVGVGANDDNNGGIGCGGGARGGLGGAGMVLIASW